MTLSNDTWIIYTDGASRGNPGPASYGAVVIDPSGRIVAELSEAIGVTTNNVAEYRGLVAGPHGISTDRAGDLYVAEVLEGARLHKFARKK